jgi:ribonuclease M5
MKKIKEVIVVEGTHDAATINQYVEADTIITNGSAVSVETLALIKKASKTKGVIVFLDPDFPGEKIRKTIMDAVPDACHAYLEKSKAISKNKQKVGVEHATRDDILEALDNCVHYDEFDELSLSYEEYLSLGLVGNKSLRDKVTKSLKIAPCNAKTLFKRLNMLNLTYEDIIKIIGA